jgi:hypothetical protein
LQKNTGDGDGEVDNTWADEDDIPEEYRNETLSENR